MNTDIKKRWLNEAILRTSNLQRTKNVSKASANLFELSTLFQTIFVHYPSDKLPFLRYYSRYRRLLTAFRVESDRVSLHFPHFGDKLN